jgi:hypothetical protein
VLQVIGLTIAAYSCVEVKDMALPVGLFLLLLSTSAQLPSFIYLSHFLDGKDTISTEVRALGTTSFSWHTQLRAALIVDMLLEVRAAQADVVRACLYGSRGVQCHRMQSCKGST